MHLLLLEQDAELAELLVDSLVRDEHQVTRAATCDEALRRLEETEHDALVLGTEVRGEDTSWCAAVRKDGHAVPILVLGERASVARRVEVLDAGADDFLSRPFALAELRARLRALGRRLPRIRAAELLCGQVRIQLATRRVWVSAEEVALTAREWALLELITRRRGHLVPRTEILEEIWGQVTDANQASLDVIIGRIRKKLGVGLIRTLRGEGFVLQ